MASMEHDIWIPFKSLSARHGVAPVPSDQVLQQPLPLYQHGALLEICQLFGPIWTFEDAYKLALEVIKRVYIARYNGSPWSYDGFGGNVDTYDQMASEVATLERAFRFATGDELMGIPRDRFNALSETARRAWIWRFATLQDQWCMAAELDLEEIWRNWEMKEVDMDVDFARKRSGHEVMVRNGRTMLIRYKSGNMDKASSLKPNDAKDVYGMDVDSPEQSKPRSTQEEFNSLMQKVIDDETALHRLNKDTRLKADEMRRLLKVKRDRLDKLKDAILG